MHYNNNKKTRFCLFFFSLSLMVNSNTTWKMIEKSNDMRIIDYATSSSTSAALSVRLKSMSSSKMSHMKELGSRVELGRLLLPTFTTSKTIS